MTRTPNPCPSCRAGNLISDTVDKAVYANDGRAHVVTGIPVRICDACDTEIIDEEAFAALTKAYDHPEGAECELTVPVYNYDTLRRLVSV